MDAITTDFGEVLLWSFWFFIWIAALMVWFRCLFDLFGDSSLSGWGKAGWAVLLIFVPWVGVLIYLIARSKSMTERQLAAVHRCRPNRTSTSSRLPARREARSSRSPAPRSCLTQGRSAKQSSTR